MKTFKKITKTVAGAVVIGLCGLSLLSLSAFAIGNAAMFFGVAVVVIVVVNAVS